MAKTSQAILTAIAFCMLGLFAPITAWAKGAPITVEAADPNFAFQADDDKPIKLKGRHLPEQADVLFILNKPGDPADGDIEQVRVSGPIVLNSATGDLEFKISVQQQAVLGDYDIEVIELSSGRKGKGTTLFNVQAKPNQDQDIFSPVVIEAEFYAGDSVEAMEYADPYVPGYTHGWTGAGERQGYFGPDAYNFDSWDTNDLSEVPRLCEVTSVGNPPSAGRYDCFDGAGTGEWNHGGLISIPLAGMAWRDQTVGKNGRPKDEPGFCDLLGAMSSAADYLEFGVTRYSIFFTEGCPDAYGNCPIEVGTLSYSGATEQAVRLHPFHGLSGLPDVGRLSIRGYASGNPVWAAPPELNVFTEPQDLPIEKFRVEFYAVKNGALLAVCETTDSWDSTIWLRTGPLQSP